MPKKNDTFGNFFGRQPTKILKIGTLDAISFTGANFTKQNFVIFQRCAGHFHDLSRFPVTAGIYSRER